LEGSSQEQSVENKTELSEPQQKTAATGKQAKGLLDRLAAGLGTNQVSEHSDDSDDEDDEYSNEEKVHVEGGLTERIAHAIRGDADSDDS
jgi:hypothetical protein